MDDDSTKPPFEPGDKPYCFLGKELLNGTSDWQKMVKEIIHHGPYNLPQLAGQLEVSINELKNLFFHDDFRCLDFKRGARLHTLYERYVPDKVSQDNYNRYW